jgi:deoxyribonuclease-4
MNKPLFGPGGNSEAFALAGHRSTLEAPAWLSKIGLDAYEYEAGNGLSARPEMLALVGAEAKLHGIHMYEYPFPGGEGICIRSKTV